MDELDENLFEAWREVGKILQDRPWSMARRMERASRKELRRPVRAWCVALRASDSRIGAHEWRDPSQADRAADGHNHQLTLTGQRLRQLCKPVAIDWPGVTVPEAAKLLGRDERTTWSWVKKGRLEMANPNKHTIGGNQLVWCPPLDPQADDGKGPWEVWGSLWQGLSENIPADYEQQVERTVRLRTKRRDDDGHPGRGRGHYRGWDWKCPGRVLATGQHIPCGRICKKLWLPLPVWTIGDHLEGRAGGAWEQLPKYDIGRSRLACSKCWGIRFDPVHSDPDEAWNRFVSVISGGLLYGHEVLMPREWLHALY